MNPGADRVTMLDSHTGSKRGAEEAVQADWTEPNVSADTLPAPRGDIVKIVHVEAGRHAYGGAQQVRYLIRELAARGVRNVLVCPPGAEVAQGLDGTCELVELRMRGDLDLGVAFRLRRLLARTEPDLVHVHSRRGADLYAALAARGRWPAVLTRRVDNREIAAWARRKYASYAALVAISSAVERRLVEAGVAAERIHRVPSGVDAQRFRPEAAARARLRAVFDLPADAFAVGVVAQLIPRKGHAELFDWLPGLLARRPQLVVLCFGRGPLAGPLERRIAAAGLAGRVRLVGFRHDLAELLPGLDVLVHPARAEGLGVAVLEALAAGVPVVAAAAGGIVDVIEHDVSGLLAPPGAGSAWIEAIDALIADPVRRRGLAAAGRRRVEQRFSVGRMAAGNLAVYETVLAGAKAAVNGRPRVGQR